MSEKCVYCGTQKGKRECPALGGMICSRCCGEHRGVKISCPPDCRYFRKHEEFQQSKQAESYRDSWIEKNEDILKAEDRKLIEAVGILEILVHSRYQENTTLTDQEVIQGLKGLENQVKTIEVPGTPSEFADFAHDQLKPLLNKEKISRQKLRKAISRLLDVAKSFSDDSRRLVQGMVGRVKEDYDLPEAESGPPAEKIESLITTPGDIERR